MSATTVAVDVLLAVAVAVQLACCVGVAVMRNPYDRLHFLGPASTLGATLFAAAVLVRHSSGQACIKIVLILVGVLVISPVLTHATARAARIRESGSLDIPREAGDGP